MVYAVMGIAAVLAIVAQLLLQYVINDIDVINNINVVVVALCLLCWGLCVCPSNGYFK